MANKKVNVEQLDQEIQEKLGVNLMQYRNEEIAENIIDMLVFPAYAISWVIRPIIIAFIIYILGFFILDLSVVEMIVYGIIALVLFFLCGLFGGLMYFVRKLKNDISGIVDYTLNVMTSSIADSEKVKGSIPVDKQGESMSLLFKGITHIVVLPVVSKVLSNKIPIFGMLMSGFVEKILSTVAGRMNFENEVVGEEPSEKLSEAKVGSTKSMEKFEGRMKSAKSGIVKIIDITTDIARYPLSFIFWICFIILAIFIYVIH